MKKSKAHILNESIIGANEYVAVVWFENKNCQLLHPTNLKLRLFIHGKEIIPENLEKIEKIKEATEIVKRINIENGILKKAFEISLENELSFENKSEDDEKRIVYQVLDGIGNFKIKIPQNQACVIIYYIVYIRVYTIVI